MTGKSGAIRAGRAFVEAFWEDSALRRGMASAERRMRAFASGLRSYGQQALKLGLSIGAPLIASAVGFAKYGDAIQKAAIRTGTTAESMSALAYAASLSGTSIQDVEKSMAKMNQNMLNLRDGAAGATEDFAALGLSWADLENMSTEDRFLTIADRLSKISDAGERSAMAMRVFGKSGTMLIPLLENGAKGIRDAMAEAFADGHVISQADADNAALLNDAFDRLTKQVKALALAVGGALAPMLTKIADATRGPLASAIEWMKANSGLVITIAKVAAGLVGLSAVLFALSGVFTVISFAIKAFLVGLIAVKAVVLAIMSPLGLLAAGALAFGANTETGVKMAGDSVDWLKGKFAPLASDAKAAWGSISQSLANGNIGAAAKVAWAFLKLEWTRGVGFLSEKWVEFKGFFAEVWARAVSNAAGIGVRLWTSLKNGWLTVVDFFRDSWASFVSFFEKAWIRLKSLGGDNLRDKATQTTIDKLNAKIAEAEKAGQSRTSLAKMRNQVRMLEATLGPDTGQQLAAVDAAQVAEKAERQRVREAAQSANNAERDGTIDVLGDMLNGELAELDAKQSRESAAANAAASSDLAAAMKDFQDSITEASETLKPGRASGLLSGGALGSAMATVSANAKAGMNRVMESQTALSTFNAFAVQGLGESIQKQQLDATKEIARNTRKRAKLPSDERTSGEEV